MAKGFPAPPLLRQANPGVPGAPARTNELAQARRAAGLHRPAKPTAAQLKLGRSLRARYESAPVAPVEAGIGGHFGNFLNDMLANLGKEAIAAGPGVVHLTGDLLSMNPRRQRAAFEGLGTGIYHSFGQTIHHPLGQLRNQPLVFGSNVAFPLAGAGSVFGRAANVAEAAGAGENIARAALRPRIVRQSLTMGKETVHPLAVKNPGYAYAQKATNSLRQFMLDNPGSLVSRVLAPIVRPQRFYGKVLGEEQQLAKARLNAPRTTLEQHGPSMRASAAGKARIFGGGKGTTAAQNAGAFHLSSNITPKVAASFYEQAIQHIQAGDVRFLPALPEGASPAQVAEYGRVQQAAISNLEHALAQTRASSRYINESGEITHGPTRQVIAAERTLSQETERLRLSHGSIQPEQALIRLGLENALYHWGAGGFRGDWLGARLNGLRDALRGNVPKDVPATIAKLEARQALKPRDQARLNTLRDYQTARQEALGLGQSVKDAGGYYVPAQRETGNIFQRRNPQPPQTSEVIRAPQQHETFKPYTGKLQMLGEHRMNTVALLARNFGRPAAIEWLRGTHTRLWNAASETARPGVKYRVIIDKNQMDDALKAIVNREYSGGATSEELAMLSPSERELVLQRESANLIERMAPRSGAGLEPGTYKFLPESTFKQAVPGYEPIDKITRGANNFNQLIRSGRYSPAYARWFVQNGQLLLNQQGFSLPFNAIALAKFMREADPQLIGRMAAESGSGYALAGLTDATALRAFVTRLARSWHHLNDYYQRMLSFVHEARREGIDVSDPRALADLLTNPAKREQLDRIARQAQEEPIKYTGGAAPGLTRWVTSWPWLRGATRWATRFPFQHPYQTSAIAQASEQARKQQGAFYKAYGGVVPPWLERIMPFGGLGVNTSIINPAETAGGLLEGMVGASKGQGAYAGELAGQASPVAQLFTELYSGRDRYGRLIPAGQAGADVLKRFLPIGAGLVGTKQATPASVTSKGWQGALTRILGSPAEPYNWRQAAKTGVKDITLQTGDQYSSNPKKVLDFIHGALSAAEQAGVAHAVLDEIERATASITSDKALNDKGKARGLGTIAAALNKLIKARQLSVGTK